MKEDIEKIINEELEKIAKEEQKESKKETKDNQELLQFFLMFYTILI